MDPAAGAGHLFGGEAGEVGEIIDGSRQPAGPEPGAAADVVFPEA